MCRESRVDAIHRDTKALLPVVAFLDDRIMKPNIRIGWRLTRQGLVRANQDWGMPRYYMGQRQRNLDWKKDCRVALGSSVRGGLPRTWIGGVIDVRCSPTPT